MERRRDADGLGAHRRIEPQAFDLVSSSDTRKSSESLTMKIGQV
jgi:hypothetical protein